MAQNHSSLSLRLFTFGEDPEGIIGYEKGLITIKGKLAHNFMISHLVFHVCLLDLVKTLKTENN